MINGVNFTPLSGYLAVEGLKFGSKELCSRFLFIGVDKISYRIILKSKPFLSPHLMKVFEQIQQLQRIHQLIAAGQTGSPKEFAQKLGISSRRLYDILDELKNRGAPIAYSISDKSYFYNKDFQLDISCEFCHLPPKE